MGINTGNRDCLFCRAEQVKTQIDRDTPCECWIYEDDDCYAVLSPEQYTEGHTLVILQEHKNDVSCEVDSQVAAAFFSVVQKIAAVLKKSMVNEEGKRPENVYVGILCDGVKHLHAHLIPRYPFDDRDREYYRLAFTDRDGSDRVTQAIMQNDMGGFWYVAERERRCVVPSKLPQEAKKRVVRLIEKRAAGVREALIKEG